jgi:predicted Zn-ribbon and HTH transcriptional regulator
MSAKPTPDAPRPKPAAQAPSFIPEETDSHLRERMQKAEKGHALRPGALCPHCGGHAFTRAELKSGAACPACGQMPRAVA